MSISREQFERIRRWRNVYLKTPDGKRCLYEHLRVTGLFLDPDEICTRLTKNPALVETLLMGINLLYALGVWTDDNFAFLIDKMGELPIPNIEENDNG